jgi:3-deoxy-7-phosphoheptulonate synthase
VEFLRGVTNPVAVKLGPQATPEEVVDLCGRLNPLRVPGRLTLIPRLGFTRVSTVLPALIRAVQASHHPVVWACDPMHGNLVRTRSGHKTRLLAHILLEVTAWIDVHRAEGSWPGGLHLEITAEDVAECRDLGELEDSEVDGVYTSLCDPRLNPRQSLELVTRVAALWPQRTTTRRTGIAP